MKYELYTVSAKIEGEEVVLGIAFDEGLEDYLDLESEELAEIVENIRLATADLFNYITRGE